MSPTSLGAVVVGQVDDFQDSTEQNWAWGRIGVGGPENVSPGQGGVSDLFLQNESFGGDDAPGTRMAILNEVQWTGDFLTAGIKEIRLDAINLGPNFAFEDMYLRIAFSSDTALTGSGRVVTNDSFLLTRDSGWHELLFGLDPATDLIALAGSDIPEVMSSVSQMRIISAELPSFIGEQNIARLGVDNITGLPEPGTIVLLLIMGVSTGLPGIRRRCCSEIRI